MSNIALVDCNNFYVACEQVFQPGLYKSPVVVLSNNDGCVIARSNQAKALGIKMGAPAFRYRKLFNQYHVHIFSSNYTLYGDMSQRVMATLAGFAPRMEVYSIDEAFLDLTGFDPQVLGDYARLISRTVKKWTGLPVSIGIGPTKTLAKIANKLAKNSSTSNYILDPFDLHCFEEQLARVKVDDVWGIGSRYASFLHHRGITTALELQKAPDWWIKKHLTIIGLQTVLELRGIGCFELEERPLSNKSIACSRSFPAPVKAIPDLQEALSSYVQRAGQKLRAQGLETGCVQVFIQTNRFASCPQYQAQSYKVLACPTSFTPDLIKTARQILEHLFRPGFNYQKIGVVLTRLAPQARRQLRFTDLKEIKGQRQKKQLMDTLDKLTSLYGRDIIQIGQVRDTSHKKWPIRRRHLSKRYTTSWQELPRAS